MIIALRYFFICIYIFIKEKKFLKKKSRVINGGIASQYRKLKKLAHKGDPISVYLSILCLEIWVILIEKVLKVKRYLKRCTYRMMILHFS